MGGSAPVKALLAFLSAMCAVPAVASADVREISVPTVPGESYSAFSVAGDYQLAALVSPAGAAGRPTYRFLLSADEGRSFSPVALPASDVLAVDDATVDPDGRWWVTAFRVPVAGRPSTDLIMTAPDGTQTTVASLPPDSQGQVPRMTAPVAAYGTHFTALDMSGQLQLRRVTPAGLDPAAVVLGPDDCLPDLVDDDRGLWVLCDDKAWLVGPDGVPRPSAYTLPLELLGTDLRQLDGRLYRPITSEVWWAVQGLEGTIRRLQPVAGGVFASMDDGRRLVITGSLGTYGPLGSLEPDSAKMIATANAIRAQQGLPALIGDPVISLASRNHARYQLRWNRPGLSAHSEDMSQQGATGESPADRCAAVGAVCGSEILFNGIRDPEEAVWQWWTTPGHRIIIGTPTQVTAGGAMVADATGAVNVINGGFATDSVAVAPIGLPRGTWTGPVEFSGEIPDPGAPCKLEAPYGVAQTAYGYTDPATGTDWEPGRIALLDVTTGKPVAGCSPGDRPYNVPAAALVPGHTYRASTTYTSDHGSRPFAWTFRISAHPRDGSGSRPAAGRRARRCLRLTGVTRTRVRTLRKGVTLRIRSCRSGRARLELRSRRSRLWRRSVRVRANRTVKVRLKARAKTGAVTITVTLGRDRVRHTLHVRR